MDTIFFKIKRQNHSLQKTILLITLIFTIVIGSILSLFTYFIYSSYAQRDLIQNTNTNLSFMTDSINNNFDDVSSLLGFCQTHSYINAFLNNTSPVSDLTTLKAYERLYEEYQANRVHSHLQRLVVANSDDRYLQIVESAYSTSENVALLLRNSEIFETQLTSEKLDLTHGFSTDLCLPRNSKAVLYLIRPIYHTYNNVLNGYVAVGLKNTIFTDPLRYYSIPEGGALYLMLGEHTYLMTEDSISEIAPDALSLEASSKQFLSDEAESGSFYDASSDTHGFFVKKPLALENCYITQLISHRQLSSFKPLCLIFILVIMLLIVFIGFILSAILYRIIYIPVNMIQLRLAKIATGDFKRDLSIEWKHELGDIGRGINDLSENIVTLMEAKIQDEQAKKDLEYKMLQNQINPHFIYNTLNSIRWMAVTQGADGIVEMTTAFSRLLRSISKGTKLLIPLEQELSLVQDYFTIQQYRYGGSLHMYIHVEDSSLYQAQIIKFSLQPLVENAIFHGIEPKQTEGSISIDVYRERVNTVCITVTDDGIGMSEETITRILTEQKNEASGFFKEVGISNIQKRLQYEFGDAYGIFIESELNKFTKITVKIPNTISS